MNQELILAAYGKGFAPIGDPVLDRLFDTYNEASPRADVANYYRFLYHLAKELDDGATPLLFKELGCKYGAASLHLLCGNKNAMAFAIDLSPLVKKEVYTHATPDVYGRSRFSFERVSSIDKKHAGLHSDDVFDIILVDTDHQYKTTAEEFKLWEPKLRKGGIMLFDDIDAPEYVDGCGKFFRELSGSRLSLPLLHPEQWGHGSGSNHRKGRMREDHLELLEKMFPNGFLIVYPNPKQDDVKMAFSCEKVTPACDLMIKMMESSKTLCVN